jgi:hypothetical protein
MLYATHFAAYSNPLAGLKITLVYTETQEVSLRNQRTVLVEAISSSVRKLFRLKLPPWKPPRKLKDGSMMGDCHTAQRTGGSQ